LNYFFALNRRESPTIVMAGLDPAIHVLLLAFALDHPLSRVMTTEIVTAA